MQSKNEMQKVFDTVAIQLMEVAHKAKEDITFKKRYLFISPVDGCRCGLGVLLPKDWTYEDSKYLESVVFPTDVEEQSIQQIDGNYKYKVHQQHSFIDEIKKNGYNLSWAQHRFFLGRLQRIHDANKSVEWYKMLQELAFNHGLDHAALNKAWKENDVDVTAHI